MTVRVAVVGNRGANIGAWMAGDLALAGYEVRFALWDDQRECLDTVRSAGGIIIEPPVSETVSGLSGLGVPKILTNDPAEAIAGADVVVMDVAAIELEERAGALIPYLENDQVLYINSHAHWSGLRLASALRSADKADVIVVDGIVPTVSADRTGATVTPIFMRREVPVSAFPANRTQEAMERLRLILASIEVRRDTIETNFENMDMLVHPAMGLLNVGYFDRSEARGESIDFYGAGNTVHTGLLSEAMDTERRAVCEAFGVRYRPLLENIHRLYGGGGETVHEAVKDAPLYRNLKPIPNHTWRAWMGADVPLAHVPFVQLAESVGENVPLHRGFVNIADVLLGTNSWDDGLTLQRLGLSGMTPMQIRQYVETGNPAV
jgi:opine dehydrogenase